MSTIAERLKKLRLDNNMTLNDIVTELKLNQSTTSISNNENDRHKPNIDLVIAYSNYFNVSTDWILKGEEFSPTSAESKLNKELEEAEELIIRSAIQVDSLKKAIEEAYRLMAARNADKFK